MAPENVELVRLSYVLLEELREAKPGTLERAFRECFDERLEVRIPDAHPEGAQVFRGRVGLMRWVESTMEIWDEWRFERERFLDAGDRVVVLVRVVARGGSSGVSLDRETAHLWTLRDGPVLRCDVYLDRSAALEPWGWGSSRRRGVSRRPSDGTSGHERVTDAVARHHPHAVHVGGRRRH